MSWILAVVGALLGALFSEGEFFGFVFGGLIGALWGRSMTLSARIEDLRTSLRNDAAIRASKLTASRSAEPGVLPTEPKPPAQQVKVDVEAAGAVAPEPADAWREPAAPMPSSATARTTTDEPEAAAPPPVAVIRREPDLLDRGWAWLKRWFSEGNVPVKIGMLVLFFGVAALLKYAADQGMFTAPIEFRLSAVAAAALGGLWFAWGKRESRRSFSLSLQGGALGVLLLTVFAAFRMYSVLPAGPALVMVLLVVAASGLLAVLQNAMALAVLGSIGGFLAPVLLSTGSGSHVGLFSYYALLNAAIFGVAWSRSWRPLNLVGFVFTFAIGSLWGWRYYRPEFFSTTEPFLILFFLMYVAIGFLFALRQPAERRGLVDGSLLFGTPLLSAGLQAGLLHDDEIGMAISALLVAAIYTLLAYLSRARQGLTTLSLSYASLALGFATVAVPLALDADVTAQVWALEGAAVLWLGLRQQRRSQVLAGLFLQLIGLVAWLLALLWFNPNSTQALLNGVFVGGVMLAFALGCSARLLEREDQPPVLAWAAFGLAIAVWALTGLHEVDLFAPSTEQQPALALWLGLSFLLSALLRAHLAWPRIGGVVVLAMPASLLLALGYGGDPVLQGWGLLAWPLWLASALFALHALADPIARGVSWAHSAFLAAVAVLAGSELHARASQWLPADSAWPWLAAFMPLLLLVWGSLGTAPRLSWPLTALYRRYRMRWLLPATMVLAVAWILSLGHDGSARPLPYLTLLNPLELTQLAVLLLSWSVAMELQVEARLRIGSAALAGFVWISSVTLRGVHHYGGEPWTDSLARSMLAQTSLTVVWSVLGVGAWILGSRRGSRPIWLAGAVLMGVVLAKLVLVDRQHMGNIPGIVSFLAVGLLLTAVGYFAPSPPKHPETDEQENPA